MKQTIELMNQGLVQQNVPAPEQLAIIDSLPIPLYQSVRNFRAKGPSEMVDIGYNATKQIWFYGLKFHPIVSPSGLILIFVLSSTSFHDVSVCEDLLFDFHIPVMIGDAGYIGKSVAQRCLNHGTHLIATPRKNMKQLEIDYRPIKVIRKTVETLFSSLQRFGIERLTCISTPSDYVKNLAFDIAIQPFRS